MRNEINAKSLQKQITKDLLQYFFVVTCNPEKLTKAEKDTMIKDLELKFTSNDKYYLKTVILQSSQEKVGKI